MISQNTIQQILGRIDIIDVIGGFVKLKKRGTNYLGLCPFHNERTPSFTVSPSKEIYKCFGCGKSGNTISFLMEHEKYSYVDSLRWLANKYGIEIEETFASDEQRQQMQVADSLYIINNFAQQFFTKTLFESEEGRDIGLSYLKERGFREDIIRKFQLGYNPEARDSFTRAAIAAQYNSELLVKTGLVVNRNDQLMDNYRGRVIFPVHNHSGKVLGFGARILKTSDKAPKYINTPENEIYVKSKILYGSYFARQAIDKADECLLVEGYTDVVSLHQSGVENVVASGGTSLTQDQLRLIRKYSNNLTIVYDGDAAGVKAALRGLDLALEEGLNVKLVLIPDKEDPDSYVNKVGPTAFSDFVRNNKKDFILFQLEVALKDAGNDTTKKSEVVNNIAETISKINKAEDFTKQQDYIKQCSEILKIDESGMHALVNKFIRNRISTQEKVLPFEEAKLHEENARKAAETDYDDTTYTLLFKDELQEKEFARVLIEHGHKKWNGGLVSGHMFEEIFEHAMFDNAEDFKIFENADVLRLINEYNHLIKNRKPNLDKTIFVYHQDLAISTFAVALLNFPYEESERWKKEFSSSSGYQEKFFDLDYENFMKTIQRENEKELLKYLKMDEDKTHLEVESALGYLKLKKIKRMIAENLRDLEKSPSKEEYAVLKNTGEFLIEIESKLELVMKTHEYIKEKERKITEKLGTAIIK